MSRAYLNLAFMAWLAPGGAVQVSPRNHEQVAEGCRRIRSPVPNIRFVAVTEDAVVAEHLSSRRG